MLTEELFKQLTLLIHELPSNTSTIKRNKMIIESRCYWNYIVTTSSDAVFYKFHPPSQVSKPSLYISRAVITALNISACDIKTGIVR